MIVGVGAKVEEITTTGALVVAVVGPLVDGVTTVVVSFAKTQSCDRKQNLS